MIAAVIRWSARSILLILIATAALVAGGVYSVGRLSLDAIPDLSDTQVIVYTEMPGQAPQVVEDQITYPLTTALLAVPRSRAVRGFSFFGVSFVYVIFEDGADIYWARSRVLEYLASGTAKLPPDVKPALGPDATGVGWVYQYVVLVERGEGKYEPRPVKLGARVPGFVQVLDGLKPGERVVTQATFLIDAESNLRAALAAFGAGENKGDGK